MEAFSRPPQGQNLGRRPVGARPLRDPRRLAALAILALAASCATRETKSPGLLASARPMPEVFASRATPRPPFRFDPADLSTLDEVQRGCFNLFWSEAARINPRTLMVPDRTSGSMVSVAGVGFQLAALCIGVERAWAPRDEAAARAEKILATLLDHPGNRRDGIYQHFLNGATAGPEGVNVQDVCSTIDTALLLCGAVVAGEYFGGRVRELADRMLAEANWAAYAGGDEAKAHEKGFISLGFKPNDPTNPAGPGTRLPYYWMDSGCEHRLVTFLGVAAPTPEHRVEPSLYYKLRRQLGSHASSSPPPGSPADTGPLAWFPYSGALFTATFSHCFMDYAGMGMDDPQALGAINRPRVDWWENSRRLVHLHRLKCAENPMRLPTLGPDAWGLNASDYPKGYLVAGVYPTLLPQDGWTEDIDFTSFRQDDAWGDGTIAPYSAASAVMFEPQLALRAIRHFRERSKGEGLARVWSDPAAGGLGFCDAFNEDADLAQSGNQPWVANDALAIDHGSMLVAIENARTGLIWRLFHRHPAIRAGMDRLRLGLRR